MFVLERNQTKVGLKPLIIMAIVIGGFIERNQTKVGLKQDGVQGAEGVRANGKKSDQGGIETREKYQPDEAR